MNKKEIVRQKIIEMLKRKIDRADVTDSIMGLVRNGKSIKEAADELGIEESRARAWVGAGDGKTIKIGLHDACFIMHALIHNWKDDEVEEEK